MNKAYDVLAIAAKEIGYTAWADPQQGSKYGRWYAQRVGDRGFSANNVPYCNMFTTWVLAQAGVPQPGRGVFAYVPFAIQDYERAGQRVFNHQQAQPGDLVCFDWDGDGLADHIGFVEKNFGSYLQTIEGNTTPASGGNQSNGGGVYRRTRPWNVVCAILRPKYPAAAPQVKPRVALTEEVIQQVVRRVWNGDFGNNPERLQRLAAEGYDGQRINDEVDRRDRNGKLKPTAPVPAKPAPLTIDQLANKVMAGEYGVGAQRANALGAQATEVGNYIDKRINDIAWEIWTNPNHGYGVGAEREKKLGVWNDAVQARINVIAATGR